MISVISLFDELEKIAGIASGAAKVVRGMGRNLKTTAKRFSNPVQSVKHLAHAVKTSPTHKKVLLGVEGAIAGANAAPKKDPSGEGKSRTRRALEGVGGVVGGNIGKGFTGGLAGGIAGSAAGSLVGKGIDKLRGYKPPPKAS